MSVAVYMSSIMVYNTFGEMSDQSISEFSWYLSQVEEMKELNLQENGYDMVRDFPSLLWVLRDFSKDLGLDTTDDYMEKFIKVSEDQMANKNEQQISFDKSKRRISNLFQKRSCFTLPSPVQDASRLKDLAKLDDDDLASGFIQDMRRFLQHVSLNVAPKTVDGRMMTSSIFVKYVRQIIETLNSGEIPILNNIAKDLFEFETQDFLKKFVKEIEEFSKDYKRKLPISPAKFYEDFKQYSRNTCKKFKSQTVNLSSAKLYAKNIEFLTKKIYEIFDEIAEENASESVQNSESNINRFVAEYKIPNIVNKENLKRELVQEMKTEFMDFIRDFNIKNTGPKSKEKCLEILPEFMFETFDSIYSRALDVNEAIANDLQAQLSNTSSNHQRTKNFMKEQEQMVIDLNRAKNVLSDENELLKSEIEKLKKTHRLKVDDLNENISKAEESLRAQMEKYKVSDNRVTKLEAMLDEMKSTMEKKNQEIENLKDKIENSSKLLIDHTANATGMGLGSDETSNLYELIRFLNDQVEKLNEEIKGRNQSKIGKITTKLEAKDKEIKQILEDKKKVISEMREEYGTKITELKGLYEARIEELETKLKEEYDNSKKMQTELFDKKKLELELNRSQIMNGELKERISTLEESNRAKDMKSEINQETFTKFIKQIEVIKLEKSSFEDKLMQYKEQALTASHEMKNIINCVNNVVARSRDKNVIVHMIKKLARDTRSKLAPFFKQYKIKV